MIEAVYYLCALLSGVLLGLLYFGGLWLTIKKLIRSKHPALLAMGSFTSRTVICVTAFYLIFRVGDWIGLLVGVAGFFVTKLFMVRHFRTAGHHQPYSLKEG